MGNFIAKLELPRFIPKEQILGKQVFDSEVLCIGLVEDWTYSSEGEIKMVVKIESKDKSNSTVTIPFSHIERVGQFVLLKTKRNQFIEKLKQQTYSEGEKTIRGGWGEATRDTVRYFKFRKRMETCCQLMKMYKQNYGHNDV